MAKTSAMPIHTLILIPRDTQAQPCRDFKVLSESTWPSKERFFDLQITVYFNTDVVSRR